MVHGFSQHLPTISPSRNPLRVVAMTCFTRPRARPLTIEQSKSALSMENLGGDGFQSQVADGQYFESSALMSQLAEEDRERGECEGRVSAPIMSMQRSDILLLRRIGGGAGGVVYEALHPPSMQLLAVKEIKIFEHSQRTQMIRELAALYRTQYGRRWKKGDTRGDKSGGPALFSAGPCPYILNFYDAFVDAETGTLSLVLEFMDAGSLQDLVDSGMSIDENVLVNIAYRVLRGLAFLHEHRLLHRDVKPSNLLINRRGDVKISDFGIACRLSGTDPKTSA